MKSVLKQVEADKPLIHLTEMKNVTVMFLRVSPIKCTDTELVALTNECHEIVLKASENVGCIQEISLRDGDIIFRIVFGIGRDLNHWNYCRFTILCAWKSLKTLKSVTRVDEVSVGVSTGVVCNMVIGHIARRHYTSIGLPITKAKNMMVTAHNKVECDVETLLYSRLKKCNFKWIGSIGYRGFEEGHSFSFVNVDAINNNLLHQDFETNDLDNVYSLLSRYKELEIFQEILNEIGIKNRSYAGVIIEGISRIGKSRLLDAFHMLAKTKQIRVVKLILHPRFPSRPCSVIYKILEQILKLDDCKTINEFEKTIVEKVGLIVRGEELCYLNKILRVRFKLSDQYASESDWIRHNKSIRIFEKILKANDEKLCILLDDVEYMDYMSWQYLTYAINNRNIVLGMTILEPQSWQDLSRVDIDIYKDKRLLRYTLTGLDSKSVSTLICQFLEVEGISIHVYNFFKTSKITHPGWIELFLIAMMMCHGINIIKVTPHKLAKRDFIFPPTMYVTKIPFELFPEESASGTFWYRKKSVLVCLENKSFPISQTFVDYDLKALISEIYARLSPYEQDIVKCAAILGKVFARKILERILPNHERPKTTVALENLITLRIFECAALQRCSSEVTDLAVCSFEPRSTFSDMHHLLRCRCHSAQQQLSRNACHLMEFKISIFQQATLSMMSENEKKKIHVKVFEIYKKDARKCTSCGGGSFLRIPGHEEVNVTESFLVTKNLEEISVTNDDSDKDSEVKKTVNEHKRYSVVSASELHGLFTIETGKSKRPSYLHRKYRVHPVIHGNINESLYLNNFSRIDFRKCRCLGIIEGIFTELQDHIEYIDDNEEVIEFMMKYASALINYGQPDYALKLLVMAEERNDYVNIYDAWSNPILYNQMIRKSVILSLRGTAYRVVGNYPQAESNYTEALSLLKHSFGSTEFLMCYRRLYEKVRHNVRWTFTYNASVKYSRVTISRQNIASCLSLVAKLLMIKNQPKQAKLASLQSIIFGFSTYDKSSFYDQAKLHLSVVKIFGKFGDLPFLGQVEKYMLYAIEQKRVWNNSEDVVMLMRVYFSVFNVSLLRGLLERAAQFGEKAIRLAKFFHMIRLELKILPLFIQIQMRLKRFCEVVDMLKQLREISCEDVDKSSLTWYYALCMDAKLDAGIDIESYETCANYAKQIIDEKLDVCVFRDPKSLERLAAGLWLWQMRKSDLSSLQFVQRLEFYTTNFRVDDYSYAVTLCKILECLLLLLTCCLNMKKSNKMELVLTDIKEVTRLLDKLIHILACVKPRYYMLKAYHSLQHGRISRAHLYLRRAEKIARTRKNRMAEAWIYRNKHAWKELSYNNMARNWEERIDHHYTIVWQDVDSFDLNNWSNFLYCLPIPDCFV